MTCATAYAVRTSVVIMPRPSKDNLLTDQVRNHLEAIAAQPGGWSLMRGMLTALDVRDHLVDARRRQGISQADVARRLHMGERAYANLENQRWPDLTVSQYQRWCRALNMAPRLEAFGLADPTPDETPRPDPNDPGRTK